MTRGLGLQDLASRRQAEALAEPLACLKLGSAPSRLHLTLSRRRHHRNSQIPARTAQAGAQTTAAIAPRSKRHRNASRAAASQARERDRRRGGRRRDRERHVGVGGHPPGRRRRGRCLVLRSAQIKYAHHRRLRGTTPSTRSAHSARHRRDACSTASDAPVDRRTGVGNASSKRTSGRMKTGGPGSIRSRV